MKIQSVERAFRLLNHVVDNPNSLTASNLASLTNMPVPTVHHLLSTMVQLRILAKTPSLHYEPGPKWNEYIQKQNAYRQLPEYLLRPVQTLARQTGQTTYLAAWSGDQIQILTSIDGNRAVRVSRPDDPYNLAHARATGKVLLAYAPRDLRERYLKRNPLNPATDKTITSIVELNREFDRTLERGYAEDIGEYRPEVACMAAPLLSNDNLLAALCVSIPLSSYDTLSEATLKALLQVSGEFNLPHPLELSDG